MSIEELLIDFPDGITAHRHQFLRRRMEPVILSRTAAAGAFSTLDTKFSVADAPQGIEAGSQAPSRSFVLPVTCSSIMASARDS